MFVHVRLLIGTQHFVQRPRESNALPYDCKGKCGVVLHYVCRRCRSKNSAFIPRSGQDLTLQIHKLPYSLFLSFQGSVKCDIYFFKSFSQAANLTQVQNTSIATSSSSFGGKVGAILMFESSGSLPPGYVAPAPVSTTPASLQS